MIKYPDATVACFDPTQGDLPRRSLDRERLQQFLQKLGEAGAESVLIAASTGQGHLRTVGELEGVSSSCCTCCSAQPFSEWRCSGQRMGSTRIVEL